MIKLGKKGFMLAETLVVSSVLLITFTFLYVQFFDVLNKYTIYSDYDNIDKLYNVYNIKEFVREDNFDAIINQLNNNIGNNTPYVDLTDCSMFSETEYCTTLFDQLNVRRLLFTNYDLDLFSNWNGINHNFSKNLQTYINTLQANYGELYNNFYRIIVEYEDGSFSTGRLSVGDVTDISTDWSEWQPLGSTSSVDYKEVAYFDGVNDYADLGYGAGINPSSSPHSFLLWVKPYDISSEKFMLMTTAQLGEDRFYLGKTGSVWDIGIQDDPWDGNTTATVTTDWVYLAVVFDGLNAKLYVDGNLEKTVSYTSFDFAKNIVLGYNDANNYWFNGEMKAVAIFNDDLSQSQVQTYISALPTGNETELIAYYNFNDIKGTTITDLSGNDNHGDIINISKKYIPYPNDNKAIGYMDFDGSNDRIEIPHSTSLSVSGTDEITEMAWVNPRAYVAYGTIATKGSEYFFQIHSDGKVGVYTYWDNGGVRASSAYFYSNSIVPLDEWTHVAFTEDNTGFRKIYINGVLDNSDQFQASIWSESNTLRIGAETDSRYFNGKIRDVSIFNRDLSQTEIQAVMNNGLSGVESGLLAYYPLHDGNGNVATDYLNKNNGTVIDGTWGYTYSPQTNIFKDLINPKVEEIDVSGTLTDVVTRNNSLYEVQTKIDSYRYNDYALSFNGSGGYATIPTTGYDAYTNMTISVDFTMNSYIGSGTKAYNTIFSWYRDGTASGNSAIVHPLVYEDGRLYVRMGNNSTESYIISPAGTIEFGKRYNMTITIESGRATLYLNGNYIGTDTLASYPNIVSRSINLAVWPAYSDYSNIDFYDMKIYNKTLSLAEVTKLYNENYKGISNLIAHYKMEEASGSTLNNAINGTNNGSITSGNWYNRMVSKKYTNDNMLELHPYVDVSFLYRYRLISE